MRVEKGIVKVTFGSGASEREVSREVSYSIPENADDVLGLLQNKDSLDEVLANIKYASSLKARNKVRAAILDSEAGPDKAIDKAIADANKARIASGKPEMTADQVTAFRAMMLG